MVVMLFTFDVSFVQLWGHLCKAGYWLIPILGLWIPIYLINAIAWRCIIKGNTDENERVSFWNIFKYTISGYALNYATPMGGFGGEPYRIMRLSENMSNQHASSSVILYSMMHLLAHFLLWFSSLFLYFALAMMGFVPFNVWIGSSLLLIALFCMLAFYIFYKGYKNGFVVRVIRWIGKIPGLKSWTNRFLERHTKTLSEIDEQIVALHKQDKRTFYTSLALEYIARFIQSFEIMFMLILFEVNFGGGISGYFLTFFNSVLILSCTTFFANLIGFLPMQLGVQEGGFVISITLLGLSPAVGMFISIICRVREIIWIFIGIILMKIDR